MLASTQVWETTLVLMSLDQWRVRCHVVSSLTKFHHSAASRGKKNIVVRLREIPSMSRPLFGSYPTLTQLSLCSGTTHTHNCIPNLYLGVSISPLIGEGVLSRAWGKVWRIMRIKWLLVHSLWNFGHNEPPLCETFPIYPLHSVCVCVYPNGEFLCISLRHFDH